MQKHVQKYLVVPEQSGGEKWRRQTEPHLHKVSSDTYKNVNNDTC